MAYDMGQVSSAFDTLSNKVLGELETQFNKGRIKGTDYSAAYTNLMNTILQLAMDAPLKEKQSNQYDNDARLKERQIQGFDDKIRSDLFKTQMDSWSMMFASGMLEEKPDIITNDETSVLYQDIKNTLR